MTVTLLLAAVLLLDTLVLTAGFGFAAWYLRRTFRQAETAAEAAPDEETLRRAREAEEAFRTLMNYTAADAYGMNGGGTYADDDGE